MGVLEDYRKAYREFLDDTGKLATGAFYPVADAYWLDGNIVVKVEVPGFTKEQLPSKIITRRTTDLFGKTRREKILVIEGKRDELKDVLKSQKNSEIIFTHRPSKFVKEIYLDINEDDDPKIDEKACSLAEGVLTISITNLKKTKAIICYPV